MNGESTLPVEVYQGHDFYVPSYRIKVGEKELLEEVHDVVRVSYSDSLEEVDSFDLTVNNWDPDLGDFKYSDSDTFNPWKDVELWMGYYKGGQDDRRRMLIGEITTMTPSFQASGGSTLTVRGLNLFHRFRTAKLTHAFFEKTDTEIAKFLIEKIAEEVKKKSPKLELELGPEDLKRKGERKVNYLAMHNQTPIVFLMQRARRIGYELTLSEEQAEDKRRVIFGFRPTNKVHRPTYILEWGKTLISFQPTFQVANQVAEVTVRGWSPRTKEKVEFTATRAHMVEEGVISPSDLGVEEPGLAQKIEKVVDRPIEDQAEAEELARKILRQTAADMVKARGKTIGVPDLRAGSKVEIRGLGQRFSGIYVVTKTTHSIGEGGYTTDFSARKENP